MASTVGWRWIFGLLAILAGSCLFTIILLFPETNRNIVGDGSLPTSGLHRTLWSLWFSRGNHKFHSTDEQTQAKQSSAFIFPNPLKSVRLFLYKDTAIVLYIHGVFYMTYCCLQASLSSVVIKQYRFTEFQAGLVYLPFGIGCLLASYTSGKRHRSSVPKRTVLTVPQVD
jgi:predicted MFS family arabinose efflux permease